MGGLNMMDVTRKQILLLCCMVGDTALAKGFCSNKGNTKYSCICRKTKLPVHSDVREVGWWNDWRFILNANKNTWNLPMMVFSSLCTWKSRSCCLSDLFSFSWDTCCNSSVRTWVDATSATSYTTRALWNNHGIYYFSHWGILRKYQIFESKCWRNKHILIGEVLYQKMQKGKRKKKKRKTRKANSLHIFSTGCTSSFLSWIRFLAPAPPFPQSQIESRKKYDPGEGHYVCCLGQRYVSLPEWTPVHNSERASTKY